LVGCDVLHDLVCIRTRIFVVLFGVALGCGVFCVLLVGACLGGGVFAIKPLNAVQALYALGGAVTVQAMGGLAL